MFFFLGLLASFLKVDLDIPQPITKFLSLYLLLVIGFQGGVELHEAALGWHVLITLLAAIAMAIGTSVYTFYITRTLLPVHDAGAIGATYGSVSAITFITAVAFLDSLGIPYGGHMVAALALMESPSIIVGLWLAHTYAPQDADKQYQGSSI